MCWSGSAQAHPQYLDHPITPCCFLQAHMSRRCLPESHQSESRLLHYRLSCLQSELPVQLLLAGGQELGYTGSKSIKGTKYRSHAGAGYVPVTHLYVLGDVLSFCSWDVCLRVGSWLQPERNQPADEDDSGLKEALFGAVQCFATILLPAHHSVVRLRTHWRNIYTERGHLVVVVTYGYQTIYHLHMVYLNVPNIKVKINLVNNCTDPLWGCRGWFQWRNWEICEEGKTS